MDHVGGAQGTVLLGFGLYIFALCLLLFLLLDILLKGLSVLSQLSHVQMLYWLETLDLNGSSVNRKPNRYLKCPILGLKMS